MSLKDNIVELTKDVKDIKDNSIEYIAFCKVLEHINIDIKEAMNEDQYAILELTMRLRKLWDHSSREKPFNLADVIRDLEEYYKERKEIFGDWQQ